MNFIEKKILIVEDELVVAMDIKNMLQSNGYTVTNIVASGEECLKIIPENEPHLILMDVALQGNIDGIDTAEEIRKNYSIPIIFLTAHSDEATTHRVTLIEHYGYVLKPVSFKELKTSIETSLYRYEIDERVKESEMKFRNLFEQSRDANFISSNNGTIIDMNQSMINLFGYEKDELQNISFIDLFTDSESGGEFLKLLNDKGYTDEFESRLKRKDNSGITCLISSTKLVDDLNKEYGVQGIIRDISDRKEMENEREVLLHNLGLRINELNCLFTLSDIIEKHSDSIDEILEILIEVLRVTWQYPEYTCTRIILNDLEFKTKNFQETRWMLSSDIIVNKEKYGVVEVFYLKKMPDLYEGPFMKEERSLIDAVSSRLGMFIDKINAFEDLKKSHTELENLSAHQYTVREEERTRISREIHDELGQSLTVLKMDIAWLTKAPENKFIELKSKADSMMEIIDNTIQTVRRISSDLRPGIIDDLGLCAAIEWQAGEFEKRSSIKIKYDICNESEEFIETDEQRISLFRILQEALTNIIRHSKASAADIIFTNDENAVKFIISDNGVGITEEQKNYTKSCGLIGMRERANYCGGNINIEGNQDKGTKIEVIIPINQIKDFF